MDRIQKQLKKGVLELVVLGVVAEKPTYGYELLSTLDARSKGLFHLKEGTLYPVLYRLEDDGLVAATWREMEGRANPKKYYSITELGKKELPKLQTMWEQFSGCVDQFIHSEEISQEECSQ